MKIAIVGATGPTGQLVVDRAVASGNPTVAYVRRPAALKSRSGLDIYAGDLIDTETFASALVGSDVVICTLGSRSRRDTRFMSQHLPLVTAAMAQAAVPRLVLMSALGAGPVPLAATGVGRAVFWTLSHVIFRDRTRAEAVLARTSVHVATASPGFLTDEPALANVELVPVDSVAGSRGNRIPRANVADLLMDLALHPPVNGTRVAIAPTGALTVKHHV